MKKTDATVALLFLCFVFSLVQPQAGWAVERQAGRKAPQQVVSGKKGPSQAQKDKKAAGDASQAKAATSEISPGPVNAKSAILIEVSTGAVLFEQNADEIIEPASFTKVMSLYLIFEGMREGRVHLNDDVWISESAWRTGGSKMFVGIGTKVPLEELIKGIAVVSGNDACVAAAEHMSGSTDAFVAAMNLKAKQLGMEKSHFENPHGLPSESQVTTAREMALLDTAYLQRFPEALKYHSMREYSYNNIPQYNRNHLLLKDATVDGLKTGYVTAAGYHLSATAQREGMRLLAVVMGAANPAIREREALKLLNFGFRYYALVQPFPAGQEIASVKVWKGLKDQINIYPLEAPNFLIEQSQKKLLKWEVKTPEEVVAPIHEGQSIGEVVFYVADQPKRTVILVSKEDVAPAGWFKKTWQTLFRLHKLDWRWFAGILGGIVLLALVLFFLVNRRPSFKRSH
mgnify:CR=1 FL=1